MTDDKRSQEAEDVSLREARRCDGPITEVEQAAEEILLARMRAWKGWRDEAEEIIPILARLVREGQIRELQEIALTMELGAAENKQIADRLESERVEVSLIDAYANQHNAYLAAAAVVHARIAALKQEG